MRDFDNFYVTTSEDLLCFGKLVRISRNETDFNLIAHDVYTDSRLSLSAKEGLGVRESFFGPHGQSGNDRVVPQRGLPGGKLKFSYPCEVP